MSVSRFRSVSFAMVLLLVGRAAPAQLRATPLPEEATETTVLFRVGAIVNAKRGACRNIRATVAVPIETPEQTVKLVKEDFSPQVSAVTFRDLAGGNARQMLIAIPYLESGAEATAALTYEVTTRTIIPPDESGTTAYRIPKRVPRGLRGYVGPSPVIESKHPKIKRLAKDLKEKFDEANTEGAASDWRRLEAIYDYVLDEIEYVDGPDTSALKTLAEGYADCHGRSALFIALCRASGVPARMVWVQDHVYPEFYMERGGDDEDEAEGVWLPAESAGTREFGGMPLARTIMQRGDDFRVPERKRDRLPYVIDWLEAFPAKRGGGKPSVTYLREVVGGDAPALTGRNAAPAPPAAVVNDEADARRRRDPRDPRNRFDPRPAPQRPR